MVSEEPVAPLCRVIVKHEEGGRKFFRKVGNHFRITQCCNLEYQNPKYFVFFFFCSCRRTVYRTKCNSCFSETGSRDFCVTFFFFLTVHHQIILCM
jgi:hypothetical protein